MVNTLFTPGTDTAAGIDHLANEVRRLWSHEPSATVADREQLFCELTEIDLRLHRLSIRAGAGELNETELEAVASCADRLDRLKRRWVPT